jgi:hypothetical protein
MTPIEEDGDRRYVCEGAWNLVGGLTGDVRMVAGACNHPNLLVLPLRLELIRLTA